MPRLLGFSLEVEPPWYCPLARISKSDGGTLARIVESQRLYGDGNLRLMLFEMVDGKGQEETIDNLKDDQNLHDVRLFRAGQGRVYGEAKASCHVTCGLADSGNCVLLTESVNLKGNVSWSFIGSDSDLKMFQKKLSSSGIRYHLTSISDLTGSHMLTLKQELVAKIALDQGFLDYPREIGVRELAALFGVSPATVTETVRKAVKKIVLEYFNTVNSVEFSDEYRDIKTLKKT